MDTVRGPREAYKCHVAVSTVNLRAVVLLYGSAGCVTSQTGGFRPGQPSRGFLPERARGGQETQTADKLHQLDSPPISPPSRARGTPPRASPERFRHTEFGPPQASPERRSPARRVEDGGKAGRRHAAGGAGLRGLPLFVSSALLDNRSPPVAGAKQALSLRGAAHCALARLLEARAAGGAATFGWATRTGTDGKPAAGVLAEVSTALVDYNMSEVQCWRC